MMTLELLRLRGKIDRTLFIKRQKGDILLVQVYVDDIIFGSTKKELYIKFERLVKDKFQMSSMGEPTFFLWLQVKQKENGIFISQDKYVTEVLRKFNFSYVKCANTPVDTEKTLVKDADGNDVDVHLYRSMIRSLIYPTASRPNIMKQIDIMVVQEANYGCHFTTEAEYVVVASCCGQVKQSSMVGFGEMIQYNLTTSLMMINDLDADEGVALVDETQGRNGQDMFNTSILDDAEVVAKKEVSTADSVHTAGEVVTIAGVETSKSKAKGIVMQEPSETPTPTPIVSIQQPSKDYELAARLQKEERGELTVEEKSRLFMELMDKRKKYFASLRAENIITEGSSKRARGKIEQEDAKRRRMEEGNESVELKRCLEIISDDEDDVGKAFTKSSEQMHETTTSNDPLLSGENRLKLTELMELCIQLQSRVLALETTKANQALEIRSLKRRVKKLENKASKKTHKLKRLCKIGSSTRVESSQDAGKNGQDMFDTNILDDEEVVAEKEVSTADSVHTAGEVVTTAGVETSKYKAKGIVMQEPSETPTPTPIVSTQQPSKAKDKGKAKIIEPEKPLKRKDQIMIDKEVARNLKAHMKAELEEEERLARKRKKKPTKL
nr:putative ribonuclease H-like domain-containing protein [Tanacetum cinerariifolium]